MKNYRNDVKNSANNKLKFIDIFITEIIPKVPEAKGLLEYIEQTDFFTAPTTANYNGNYVGGLVEHAILFYERVKKIVSEEYGNDYSFLETTPETLALCALCHNLCMTNCYDSEYKNVKVRDPQGRLEDEGGRFRWEAQTYYKWNPIIPYGHGEKSVMMIQSFLSNKLTLSELLAIRFHSNESITPLNNAEIDLASRNYPLVSVFRIADIQVNLIDQKCLNS